MASSHFENENLVIISSNDAINMTQWRRYIFDNLNKVNYDSQFTSVLALTCAIVISLTETTLSALSTSHFPPEENYAMWAVRATLSIFWH